MWSKCRKEGNSYLSWGNWMEACETNLNDLGWGNREKEMGPSELGLCLIWGHPHKHGTVQLGHQAPKSPVLDLMLCCHHLKILKKFLTQVLTLSLGTEPHKLCNRSCSQDRAAYGVWALWQHPTLQTSNAWLSSQRKEIWTKLNLIISLMREIHWDGIFFFLVLPDQGFIFYSLLALYLFKKLFGLQFVLV